MNDSRDHALTRNGHTDCPACIVHAKPLMFEFVHLLRSFYTIPIYSLNVLGITKLA
jgi:hypothetical protein